MKSFYLTLTLIVSYVVGYAQSIPIFTSMNAVAGVTPVIYLDFDGYRVQPFTHWTGFTDGEGFDTEHSNLSASHVRIVYEIVAEDFRPFVVAVTTDSTLYNSAPVDRRLRVVITPTYEWYGFAGGVAFLGSFGFGDDTPVWVFSTLLGDDAKYIGEAASHEVGHGMDLIHHHELDQDCNKVFEYHSGYGEEETSWAPIMGSSYNANLGTWDNGVKVRPTHCETRLRTDIELIRNYVSLKNDDHTGEPTPISLVSDSGIVRFYSSGMIRSEGDRDPFTFTLTEKTDVNLNVRSPYMQDIPFVNNIDLRLTIRKEGDWEETIRPFRKVGVNFRRMLDPGTYVLEVSGDGNEWMSSYSSLGSYEITGVGTTSAAQLMVDLGRDTAMCEIDLWENGLRLDADPVGRNPDSTYYTWKTNKGEIFQEGYDAAGQQTYIVQPGRYSVRVYNPHTIPQELFDTITISSILSIQPAFAIVNYDSTYCAPVVTFEDQSSSTCSRIDRLLYDFGDGTPPEESYAHSQISHSFPGAGSYLVKLTVFDMSGQSVDYLQPVKVYEPAPIPQNLLGPDQAICVNTLITLDPSKAIPPNTYWYWVDYSETGARRVGPGEYVMAGFVYDSVTYNSKHCDFRDTILITSSPSLLPDFDVAYNSLGNVTFVNKTTTCDGSEPSKYRWILSNGIESNEKSPTMHFTNYGETIIVTLIASSGTDTDVIEKEVTINFLRQPFLRKVARQPGVFVLPKAKGTVVNWKLRDRPVVVNANSAIRVDVLQNEVGEYQLLGVDGRLYGKGRLTAGFNEIDILRVPKGIFYLHVNSKGEENAIQLIRY